MPNKSLKSTVIGDGSLSLTKIDLIVNRKQDKDPHDWENTGTIIDKWKIDCYLKNSDNSESKITINYEIGEYDYSKWNTLTSIQFDNNSIGIDETLHRDLYAENMFFGNDFLKLTSLRLYDFVNENFVAPHFKKAEIKHPLLNKPIQFSSKGSINIPIIEARSVFFADVKGIIKEFFDHRSSTLAAQQYESKSIEKSLFLAVEYLAENIRDSNVLEQELETLLSLGLNFHKTQVCDVDMRRDETGEYLEIPYNRDQSLLLMAVENENVELVKMLLSRGSNANEIYFARFAYQTDVLPGPLEVAYRAKNQALIDLLLPLTSPLLVEYAQTWEDRDSDRQCQNEMKEEGYNLDDWSPQVDLARFQSLFEEKNEKDMVQAPVVRTKLRF